MAIIALLRTAPPRIAQHHNHHHHVRFASTFSNFIAGIKSLGQGGEKNESQQQQQPVTISSNNNSQEQQQPESIVPTDATEASQSIQVIGTPRRRYSKPSTLSTVRWKSKYKADTPELIEAAVQLVIARRLGIYNPEIDNDKLIVDGPDTAQDSRSSENKNKKIDYNEPKMSNASAHDDPFARQVLLFLSKRDSISLPADWLDMDIDSSNLSDRFDLCKQCQQFTGRIIPDVVASRAQKIRDILHFYMTDVARSRTYHEYMPGKINLEALAQTWAPNIKVLDRPIPTKRIDKERLSLLNQLPQI